MVNVGGGVGAIIYGFIPFGSWCKISAGTIPSLLLQLQYSYILVYFFSLYYIFYILFLYMFFMFILMKLITCYEFNKVKA